MSRLLFYLILLVVAGCNLPDADLPFSKKSISLPGAAMKVTTGIDGPLQTDSSILLQKIQATYRKAKAENFNTRYAFLVDLGLHSGSRRLFVIDLPKRTIVASGMVTHGSTTAYLPNGQRKYSNEEGSLCSSLGMYKIGVSYRGKFGLAYKLYGLNAENSNALVRAVVLHSHSCVPDAETASPICQSWGCPTVSPAFLKILSQYIDTSQKPMLLYLFDSSNE